MQAKQEMIDDKEQLDRKIEMLHRFMVGSQYDKLSELERDRMMRQHIAMSQYSGVLGERINGFTGS